MNRFLSLFFLIAMVAETVLGQTIIAENDFDFTGYTAIPQETIFVHVNTTLLFPAEYLYYKVYCMKERAEGYSDISKVAYVELVGEDLIPVFRHKIQLLDGVGQGDFFIPTTVPSGNYKLIAYTHWMKNAGEANFFQVDMAIINPYRKDQKSILLPNLKHDSLEIFKEGIDFIPDNPFLNSGPLKLSMNHRRFGKRAKVTFILDHTSDFDPVQGSYSVSVRKIDPLPRLPRSTTPDYLKSYDFSKRPKLPNKGSKVNLPELRGDIFSGKVLDTEDGKPASNLAIALSLPGEEYRFRIGQTNEDGTFYLNVDADYSNETAIVQILSDTPSDYAIQLDEPGSVDYSNLVFGGIKIDETMADEILKRSIHNQIESAYFIFKPDSLLPVRDEGPFLPNDMSTYQLEDYTPFRTVREALLEIIKDAWVRRNKQGSEEIEVKSIELVSNPDLLPIVLVDGGIVQDHEAVINFDARRIKTIKVYKQRYIFGPRTYQGAIVIETKNGDFLHEYHIPGARVFNTFRPQPRKKYFAQTYDGVSVSTLGNLPDDRLQLVWEPNVRLPGNTNQFYFYTSDVSGEFEISVEGFTKTGEAVSLRETFIVE